MYYNLYIDSDSVISNTLYTYESDVQLKFGSIVEVDFSNRKVMAFIVKEIEKTNSEFEIKKINKIIDLDFFNEYQHMIISKLQKVEVLSVYEILNKYKPIFDYKLSEIEYYSLNKKSVLKYRYEEKIHGSFNDDNIRLSLSNLRKISKVSTKDINKAIDSGLLTVSKDYNDYLGYVSTEKYDDLNLNISNNEINIIHDELFSINPVQIFSNTEKCIFVVKDINTYLNKFTDVVFLSNQLSEEQLQYNKYLLKNNLCTKFCITSEQLFNNFSNIDTIIIEDELHLTLNNNFIYHNLLSIYNQLFQTTIILYCQVPSLYMASLAVKEKYNYIYYKTNEIEYQFKIINERDSLFNIDVLIGIKNYLSKGENIVIYNYNHTYNSMLSCESCGFIKKCDDCGLSLSVNRDNLKCKYCKRTYKLDLKCPICGETLITSNFGSQKIIEYLTSHFNYNVTEISTRFNHTANFNKIVKFNQSKATILIADNAIFNFSNISNYSQFIISNLSSLYYSNNILNRERLQYLLIFFKNIIIQNNEIIELDNDFKSYFKNSMYLRKIYKLPPIYKQSMIILSSNDIEEMYVVINTLSNYFDNYEVIKPLISTKGKQKIRNIKINHNVNIHKQLVRFKKDNINKNILVTINEETQNIANL